MKIGILVNHIHKHYLVFEEAAKELNVDLKLFTYDDVDKILLSKKQVEFQVAGKELKNLDLIYIKNSEKNYEQAILITKYCLLNNVKIIDSALVKNQPWVDSKAYEGLVLSVAGLPTIPSIFINQKQINQVKSNVGYPCVIKKTRFTSEGRDVYLVSNQCEARKVFKQYQEPLLVQKFIPNQGDYRVFVIGDKVVTAMQRVRGKDEKFLNNIAQGAKAIPYQVNSEEASLAIKITKTLGYQIAGVDLFKTKTGWKIIEVNRSPGFRGLMGATGVNIPLEIVKYLKNKAME